MKKKYVIELLLMVLAIASANATTWKVHNYFVTSKIQNLYDTGDKVYYANSGYLFRFDKATQETVRLSKQNILSDLCKVDHLYYDWENNLLFVAYANSNIDVIDGEGNVTNISSIKDMVIPLKTYTFAKDSSGRITYDLATYVGKDIRDITFCNGIAYVAAGYGYVTIDESTLRVIENRNMGDNICVNSVGIVGEQMIILTNNYCYYGDPNSRDPRNEFQKKSATLSAARMYTINDHSFFVYGTSNFYFLNMESGTPSITQLVKGKATDVQRTTTGFVANFEGLAYYYTIDSTGRTATQASSVIGFASSHPQGDGTVWICDANGLHVSGSTAYYKLNSITTDGPYWLKYNAALNKLYAGLSGPNMTSATNTNAANVINTFDGTTWKNATAYSAKGGGYAFMFDPLDPTTYVRSSWSAGVFKVTNDVKKATYTKSNSKIGTNKPTPAIDNYGNLWLVSSWHSNDELKDSTLRFVEVLPRAKFLKNSVTSADWFVPTGLNLNTGSMQRSRFLVSKKNNVKIYSDCDYPVAPVTGRILCWDNGVEDPLVDNYKFVSLYSFVDQNNKLVDWVYLSHFEEDNEGLIWVGHTQGLFAVDPDVLFDEHPRAYRPLSPDGKGHLCEGYTVYDIGVDRNNNKWIASNDGLYFTSPDASEVYNHFTTENSDIPSDVVYSVECDTVNERVYIFTDNGFAELVENGEASALNYADVYAFPNPVEPDFTGMVKIANLMENTYVTITDRDGHIVTQIGPVMGSALWDASGEDGERVATGIYNIYVAQGAQPAVTGTPQTTVMIIK